MRFGIDSKESQPDVIQMLVYCSREELRDPILGTCGHVGWPLNWTNVTAEPSQ
jgi:hypothetical protein